METRRKGVVRPVMVTSQDSQDCARVVGPSVGYVSEVSGGARIQQTNGTHGRTDHSHRNTKRCLLSELFSKWLHVIQYTIRLLSTS